MNHEALADLEAFTLERMIETRMPCLSVALVTDEGTAYERHVGFADLTRRQPPTSSTRYGLGSVTKVFTALAVMQLCEQGNLGLETPLADVLGVELHPERPITILDLLTHSSGYPALGYSESKLSPRWFMDGYPISSLDDLLTFMRGARDWIQAPPGERWFYSNEGYVLLGAVIERLRGLRYADAVRTSILEPLGMTRSTFARQTVDSDDDHVTPYMLGRDGRLFEGSNLYSDIPAAGGLVSTLGDMGPFLTSLLRRGRTDGGQILAEASLAQMQRPVLPIQQPVFPEARNLAPGVQTERHQGIGFQIHQGFFGFDVVAHGGGVMGGTSYLAYLPEARVGVVLLANAHGYPLAQLALCYLAHLTGRDYRELAFVGQEAILRALTGRYRSYKETIEASVTPRGGGLELCLHFKHEDRRVLLIPWRLEPERASFITPSSGQLVEVSFELADPVTLVYERYAFCKAREERTLAHA
jgi:CubicO group peptidase (beta-lactamase class C family)